MNHKLMVFESILVQLRFNKLSGIATAVQIPVGKKIYLLLLLSHDLMVAIYLQINLCAQSV